MENINHNDQTPLARQSDLALKELPDELLVYDLKRHKAHCLNKTAAFVWQHCDGLTTVNDMSKLLGQEAGAPVDEKVVWYALDKLSKADLLEEKLRMLVEDGLSRRRMIRRMGAVIALPTVISLVAPTAVQAATVIVTNKKIAVGQCNNQDNPQACSEDTCCTGGNPKQLCIQVGPGSGDQVDTACAGAPCEPSGPASPCST